MAKKTRPAVQTKVLNDRPEQESAEPVESVEDLKDDDQASGDDSSDPPAAEADDEDEFEWRVLIVNCPTPLAANPAIVVASTEAHAWSCFCSLNGITGTDHPKTIERLA